MGPKAMKNAKGKAMKAMNVMKAMRKVKRRNAHSMKVKSTKVKEVEKPKFAHFVVRMTQREKTKRFHDDLCESHQEYDDVKCYNKSYHAPPPCSWRAWLKSDLAEKGWLYVKGDPAKAESWLLIKSEQLLC
eukprot:s1128_g15.t1